MVVFMTVRLVTGEYAPGGEFYNSQVRDDVFIRQFFVGRECLLLRRRPCGVLEGGPQEDQGSATEHLMDPDGSFPRPLGR